MQILTEPEALSRQQVKAVFRRNYGAAAALARDLGITRQNIYDWLKGQGRSKKVDAAIRARAAEMLAAEKSQAARV